MNSGFPLFRIFGTEIRIHWTWVLLLAFITVIFGDGLASQPDSGLDPISSWAIAVAIALLVLVSVVVHELGHVGMASRNRLGGGVVVVQLLGGAYLMELRPRTAGQELRIAAAGSIISIALTLGFATMFAVLQAIWGANDLAPTGVQAIEFVAQSLAAFNLFVAAVNLVPAYPLDGGRIVHALAWVRSGNDMTATRSATRFGRMVGYAVMIAGVAAFGLVDLWPGLALLISGWLLVGSSRVLERRLVLQELMSGTPASAAIDTEIERVPAQLTLDVFAAPFIAEKAGSADLVGRDQVLGIIGTAQVRKIARRRWPEVRTEDAMVPIAAVPHVRADTDLWSAIETLERSGFDAVVVDDMAVAPVQEGTDPGAGEENSAPAPNLMTRRSVGQVVRQRVADQVRPGYSMLRRSMLARRPGGRAPGAPPDDRSDDDLDSPKK
jgi:Zn-dependent protease